MNREQVWRKLDDWQLDELAERLEARRMQRSERPRLLGVFYRLAPRGQRRLVRWAYVGSMLFLGKWAFFAGLVGYFALGIWFRVQHIELPEE